MTSQSASLSVELTDPVTGIKALITGVLQLVMPSRPIVAAAFNGVAADWKALSDATGGIAGRRTYITPSSFGNGIPTDWANTNAGQNDAKIGATSSQISLKPSVAQTLNGALDSALTNFALTVPRGVMVNLFAEFEKASNSYTPAQLIGAFNHAYTVLKAANPDILVGQCFTQYSATPASSHSPLAQWVSDLPDFIGIDVYQNTEFETAAGKLAMAETQIRVVNADVPLVVAECGSKLPGAQRARFLTDAYGYCKVNGWPVFTTWQGINVPEYTFYPTDVLAVAAMSAIVADSKV